VGGVGVWGFGWVADLGCGFGWLADLGCGFGWVARIWRGWSSLTTSDQTLQRPPTACQPHRLPRRHSKRPAPRTFSHRNHPLLSPRPQPNTTLHTPPPSPTDQSPPKPTPHPTRYPQKVSCTEPYEWKDPTETEWEFNDNTKTAAGGKPFTVVAYDFGIKHNILRRLASFGCKIVVVPATYPADKVLAMNPDGVFFSNGPVRGGGAGGVAL